MDQNVPARLCRIHGTAMVLSRRWGYATYFGPARLTFGDYYCPARNCGVRQTLKLRPMERRIIARRSPRSRRTGA